MWRELVPLPFPDTDALVIKRKGESRMSLTRRTLSAMGIEGDKVDEIINAHVETVEQIKNERDEAKRQLSDALKQVDTYKAEAERIPDLEADIKKLKDAADSGEPDPFEAKYNDLKAENEKLKAEYDQYKADVEAKETTAKKRDAYRGLLKEAGVADKRLEAILKVADLSTIEFNKDGSVKEAEKIKESIQEEWADFIEHTGQQGAEVNTPPSNTGGGKTRQEIMSIKDRAERQRAIAENRELFGF